MPVFLFLFLLGMYVDDDNNKEEECMSGETVVVEY